MEDVEEVEVMTIGEEEIDQEEVEDVETAVIVGIAGIAEIAGKDVVVEKDHKLVNLKPTEHLSSNEY